MSALPVVPRERAWTDVDEAIAYYVGDASTDVALGFVDAVEVALARIGAYPAIGSPRWGEELDLPGLRSWPVDGYPYLVFYVVHTDHVDVWRVLHMRRDLPVALSDPPPE